MLTSRSVQLLSKLLQSAHPLTVDSLSMQFQVNPKSIRNDLKDLEYWLKSKNVGLIKKPRVGIWLEADPTAKEELSTYIHSLKEREYYIEPKKRQKIILLELLRRKEPLIVKELEILFHLSESTILRDFIDLDKRLKHSSLQIIRKPNYGVLLEGDEQARRGKEFELLMEEGEDNQFVLSDDRRSMELIIHQVLAKYKLHLTDESITSLAAYLIIMIRRIANGNNIHLSELDRKYLLGYPTRHLAAQEIAKKLEEELHINLSVDEVSYITMHLVASIYRKYAEDGEWGNEYHSVVDFAISKMMEITGNILGISFDGDEVLFKGLKLHIQPMLDRIRFNIMLSQANVIDLHANYPWVYHAAETGAKILGNLLVIEIPPQEIAFLAFTLAQPLNGKC